jgi:hypothetical protein
MHEIKAISSNGHRSENHSGPVMPIIRCTCGAGILLVPDINEMNRAIESHIDEHNKIALRNGKECVSPDCVRQILVEQILQKASETYSRQVFPPQMRNHNKTRLDL